MKIATIGRGNIGGGLGGLWQKAGHEVTLLGREGGDVSGAEVVLVAVPGETVPEALDGVRGIDGKTTIDATNLWGGAEAPNGFGSNAEYIKSRTGGPTAKSFNVNFGSLYDRVGEASSTPGNLWCGDEEARAAVEQLIRDAGYEPICIGPLQNAGIQERSLALVFAIAQEGGMGQFFYRMAPPELL